MCEAFTVRKRDSKSFTVRGPTGREFIIARTARAADGWSVEFQRDAIASRDPAIARRAVWRFYATKLTRRRAEAWARHLLARWESEDAEGCPVFRQADRLRPLAEIPAADARASWVVAKARHGVTRFLSDGHVILDVGQCLGLTAARAAALRADPGPDGATPDAAVAATWAANADPADRHAADILGWSEGPDRRWLHVDVEGRGVAIFDAAKVAFAARAVRDVGRVVAFCSGGNPAYARLGLCARGTGELAAVVAGVRVDGPGDDAMGPDVFLDVHAARARRAE